MKLTVFLVDDHDAVRSSIESILKLFDDIVVVGQAVNGQEALQKIAMLHPKPNLVLMDVNMPIMDGVEATRNLKQQYPEIRVLALSLLTESHYVNSILEAGAEGYLLKSTAPRELYEVINKKKPGNNNLNSNYKNPVENFNQPTHLSAIENNPTPDNKKTNGNNNDYKITQLALQLSNKQKEILIFLNLDYEPKVIAKKLMLGSEPLEHMINEIMQKLGVSDMNELKKYLKENNITQKF